MNVDRRTFITGIAALAAGAKFMQRAPTANAAPVRTRGGHADRFLFLDREYIDRMDGLEIRGHRAKRFSGNPLFTRKYPWEKTRLQLYGRCIVHNPERQLYQMYYLAQPHGTHFPNVRVGGATKVGFVTLPAYAESSDGIHWERPLRRDVPFEDIAETNLLDINFGQSFEPSVIWDRHDPDPGRRYKAFIWDQRFRLPLPGKLDYRRAAPSLAFPRGLLLDQLIRDEAGNIVYEQPYNDFGIMVAFSADGIHWAKHPEWVFRCYSDTGQSVVYDSNLGKYVGYGRFNQMKDSPAFYIGRNVARVESTDFIHWSEPELVLAGDDQDPDSLQINSMPVDLYEGLYIGIMELDVRPHPNPHRQIQLAVSRDGRRWTRVADRSPAIEEPPSGAWDEGDGAVYDRAGGKDGSEPHGFVRPASGLFINGDQVRMYYSNTSGRDVFGGVGMATWRRDGFVSLHAGDDGGELLTRAFVPSGPELHLNIDASQGESTIRACDFQGRPLTGWEIDQPSVPIRGDQIDAVVRWTDSDFDQRVGKATTLRIRMRNADLYSFWTR
jgi:hypothetical protein